MDSGPPLPKIMLLATTISASLIILAAILYFVYCLWDSLVRGSRTIPFDAASPLNRLRRFTLKELKSATRNFSASNSIGKGGSGAVFRGLLRDGRRVAVKLLDPVYFQGEYEFQNEVRILGGLKPCPLVIPLLGFCVEEGKRLLVYEYMPNRSLQESLLLESDSDGLILNWGRRFAIINDVVRALAFLHLECQPPVIHGDVKPSNVLLDSEFRARISDFGLSRLKLDEEEEDEEAGVDSFSQTRENGDEDEVDFAQALQASASTNKSCSRFSPSAISKGKELSTSENLDVSSDLNPGSGANQWGKDWWWKQDGSGELCSKEYVTEWIGSQICVNPENSEKIENLDAAKQDPSTQKHMKMLDWWKEEQEVEQLDEASKKVKKWRLSLPKCLEMKQIQDDDDNPEFTFRNGCTPSRSGDLLSRELSSTTSARGTFCYVAPEYSGEDGCLMEKADIYSLGVLILVTVAGRRPLHVMLSPMKFEEANLVSWSRSLAHSGNVLELVDKRLREEYDREEASLCINLALSCLQKLPELRPGIGDVLRILNGEMELRPPPFEFSPSPPWRCTHKTRRKCAE